MFQFQYRMGTALQNSPCKAENSVVEPAVWNVTVLSAKVLSW